MSRKQHIDLAYLLYILCTWCYWIGWLRVALYYEISASWLFVAAWL
jgi:hypothetical protein